MCGSKKKKTYVFISLFTWTFTVLQTSVKARPVKEVALFCLFFKDAFPQRLLPKQKHSVNVGVCVWGGLLHIQLRGGVCGGPPPSASWLWGDPATQSPCPLAHLQMGLQQWGWAVHPWCINQQALLARVFYSCCVSVFTQMHLRTTFADWVSQYVGVGGWCLSGSGCFTNMVHL